MSVKVMLNESEIPRQWYNLAADLPTKLQPPLGPDGKPISPEMLAPVFPMNLIEQEVSEQRWIDIPGEVLDILYRAADQGIAPHHLAREEAMKRYREIDRINNILC